MVTTPEGVNTMKLTKIYVLILHFVLLAYSAGRFSGVTVERGNHGKWVSYETPQARGSQRPALGPRPVSERVADGENPEEADSSDDACRASTRGTESSEDLGLDEHTRPEPRDKGERVLKALEWPSKTDKQTQNERFRAYMEAWKDTERRFRTRQRGQRAVHYALAALRRGSKRLEPEVEVKRS